MIIKWQLARGQYSDMRHLSLKSLSVSEPYGTSACALVANELMQCTEKWRDEQVIKPISDTSYDKA